jgi:ribose transport system substrate-binding protein
MVRLRPGVPVAAVRVSGISFGWLAGAVLVVLGSVFAASALGAPAGGRDQGRVAVCSNPSPGVKAAQAVVNKYLGIPKFPYSRAPHVDAAKARGKTVFIVPVSSSIPFVLGMDQGIQEAAKVAGMKAIDFPNSGMQSQIVAGIETAINRKADVLVLLAVNPKTVAPQIKRAAASGIKVVIGHEYPPGFPPIPHTVGQTVAPFYEAAKFEADYPIAKSCGKVNAFAISSLEQIAAPGMLATMKREFAKNCPGCKFTSTNVPVINWSTKIQSEVQSALVRDPKINYVIPFYDSMSQFAAPGVISAGKKGSVQIVTFNGTPFVLKMIQDKNVVTADIGEDTQWLGWAIMDQVLRAATGVPLIKDERTALRVFDENNVAEAGTPPKAGTGYGRSYITGYKKLWGIAK